MKLLYIFALGEAATGLLLLVSPSAVRLLFAGEPIGVGVIMTRIAGICLIAIGVACWPSNNLRQPLVGMLTYSALVMLYLIVLGIDGRAGTVLWAAVLLHAGISAFLLCAVFFGPKANSTASN